MPFVSRAQQRWGNSASGRKALGGQSAVNEWNHATSKGASVPQYTKGSAPSEASYAKGGGELGRSKNWAKSDPQGRGEFGKFLGTADRFSGLEAEDRVAGSPKSQKTAEDWTKPAGIGRTDKDDKGDTKSLKPIKPRK
jgi:hypothetical protein